MIAFSTSSPPRSQFATKSANWAHLRFQVFCHARYSRRLRIFLQRWHCVAFSGVFKWYCISKAIFSFYVRRYLALVIYWVVVKRQQLQRTMHFSCVLSGCQLKVPCEWYLGCQRNPKMVATIDSVTWTILFGRAKRYFTIKFIVDNLRTPAMVHVSRYTFFWLYFSIFYPTYLTYF